MATTEEVIGQTKDGRLIVYWENLGPTSYTPGGFDVTINTLRKVERIVRIGNAGGFKTESEECTITGNAIKLPVHYYNHALGCSAPVVCATGWEVRSGLDLHYFKFSGVVIGF